MKLRILPASLVAAVVLSALNSAVSQPPGLGGDNGVPPGVSVNDSKAFKGYTLVFPLNSTSTYLIDMDGRIVNEWKSEFTPAASTYLLPDGHLLRPGAERGGMAGGRPATGGRIQEFDWDGNLVWDFSISSLGREGLRPHHDICRLPNGNVLVIVGAEKTREESIAAGRRPETAPNNLETDSILEIKPTGKTSGEVVWEWHAWDHLVQDVDDSKPNYGDVSEHPELIDINFGNDQFSRMLQDPAQLARLRSLGYIGGGDSDDDDGDDEEDDNEEDEEEGDEDADARDDASDSDDDSDDADGGRGGGRGGRGRGGPGGGGDWMHTNAVAYNAELDQIMLSIHAFSEVWIIDHGTTTEEAASHSGGKRGKGGDLLYRWGNPRAYRTGTNVDQRLFAQHNAHWIPEGLPGAGNMLVFNNGGDRPDGTYSSVDEIVLPLKEDGTYEREEYVAFGPEQATWSYSAEDKSTFYSSFISGAHRLANGNTFICSGAPATVFEVTPDKEIVWQYKHPGGGFGGPGGPGGPGGFTMPQPGEILPEFLRGMLNFTDEQNESLATLQEVVAQGLKELLTEEQQEQLASAPTPGRGGPRGGQGGRGGRGGRGRRGGPGGGGPGFGLPTPGEVLSEAVQDRLDLSDEQKESLASLQQQVDKKLEEVLSDEQREQLAGMQDFGRGGPGRGFPGFGPPGDGGPDGVAGNDGDRGRGPGRGGGRGRGGRGGRGGGGPGGLFRSYRFGADYAAFVGKELTPGEKLADVAGNDDRLEQ